MYFLPTCWYDDIFNTSFTSVVFPSILQIAEVVPIHKTDSKLDFSNYGLTSLSSKFDKIFTYFLLFSFTCFLLSFSTYFLLFTFCLLFNDISLKNSVSQKHLGLTLDVKLNLVEHIKTLFRKLAIQCAYCVEFNQSYQNHPYWLNKKHSSEVSQAFLMSPTTKFITLSFMNLFNAMLAWR